MPRLRTYSLTSLILLLLVGCSNEDIRSEFDDPNAKSANGHSELVEFIVHDYQTCILRLDSIMDSGTDSMDYHIARLHKKNLNRFIAYGRQMNDLPSDQKDSCRVAMMNKLYEGVQDPMLRIREACDSMRAEDPLSETVMMCDDLVMIGQFADFETLERLRPEVYDTLKK